MKWIECSACKLKVRRSKISRNSLPEHHSFRHGLFFHSCEVPEWLGAQLTLLTAAHLKSISTWVQLQNECLPLPLSASTGLLGTKENTWWLLVEALFDGLAQLDAFLSRIPCISTSHCTSWALALTAWWAGMFLLLLCRWNGMVAFFRGVGRIFVQDEGNWTAWVSSIWERKLILGRLKELHLPWALPSSMAQKDCLGRQWEHFLCHREKPQHCFSLSGRDVLEVYSACGVLMWQGTCRPSAGAVAGRGEEWSCGSAASLGPGSPRFNSWLCCCLPVGKAWSGTLSNSVSNCSLHGIILF